MKPTEQTASRPSRNGGLFATLRASTFAKQTRAPSRLALLILSFFSALALTATPALAAPETPVTKPATAITTTTATLNGELNPGAAGEPGEWVFAYTTLSPAECEVELLVPEPFGVALGHEKEAVSAEATKLQPNRTYEFCLLALHEGLVFSPPLTFKTLAAPPMIVTEPASVKANEATLAAQVNPNNEETSYSFEYATEESLIGTPGATTIAGAGPLSGFGDQTASVTTSAVLTQATTYYYRVIAENEQTKKEGKPATGAVQSFTIVPTPHTDEVKGITGTRATFNGHLTLNPGDTQFSFAYNLGGECTGGSSTPTADAGSGPGTAASESSAVTELQPQTAYTVCFVTSNAFGSELGPPVPFTTKPAPPGIANQKHTAVTETGATLEAGVNPNNQETTYAFEYATNEALTGATTVAGAGPLTATFGEQLVSVKTGALAPRTPYFYRAVATNATAEKAEGKIESFTTLATPIATTGEALSPARTTVTLSGTVNPGGVASTYHFAYVPAGEYEPLSPNPYAKGRTTPESESVGSDYTSHPAGPLEIGELKPGVTYHYAVVAANSLGSTIGPDVAFTTAAPTPPLASSGAAEGVSQLSATVTGTVDTRGLATISQFEFGTAPYGGSLVPATVTPPNGTLVGISTSFNAALQPGTTYYYRTVATNSDGTSYGAEQSFMTGSFPAALTLPATLAFIPFASIAELEAKERAATPAPAIAKPLTKAQKLAKALKACAKKPKRQRPRCRRQAHKRYR